MQIILYTVPLVPFYYYCGQPNDIKNISTHIQSRTVNQTVGAPLA